ncbi:MAG: phosphate ABC transporter permease [Chloroflexi bacterium]|nr:MAG: phosphate ABC transporter permease [Chloroflexota bacterium]
MRTVIEPRHGWYLVDLQELRRYRDLFYFLVRRDVRVLYAQTILGFAWAVLQPFFSMIVFTVVFGGLAEMPSDGLPYAVFSFAGLVPWTYFSNALTTASQSLIGNTALLTKVYFPRLFIPMTPVVAKLVDFAIALVILLGLMAWYGIWPTWLVVWLPLLVLLMLLTAGGMGMWLAALGIQYRDVRFAMGFVTQLLMYAAPVVWPASLIPAEYRILYGLYPMAGVIEGFRAALLGSAPMPWDLIAAGLVSAAAIFAAGVLYFRQTERVFADVA